MYNSSIHKIHQQSYVKMHKIQAFSERKQTSISSLKHKKQFFRVFFLRLKVWRLRLNMLFASG